MASASGGENLTLTWNDNGNLAKKDDTYDTNMVYNWDNKLRSATNGSNSISLKYDPMGNRVYKSSSAQGTRKYIVDIAGGLPTILIEIDPCTSSLTKAYIYANGEISAQHNGDYTANRYFYLHDRLGSVREVIDTNSTVVKYYAFGSFGAALEEGGILTNPFMFTGQYYDSEIGQYYLRARYYHPTIGRFMQTDLIGYRAGLNLYTYVKNNPIMRVDPEGLYTIDSSCDSFGSISKSDIDQAIQNVMNKITTDCIKSKSLKNKLASKLPNITVKCDSKSSDCGYTFPDLKFGYSTTIYLGPPAGTSACGPLAGTILHEAIHLTQWWGSEKVPYACQNSCYGYYDPGHPSCPDDCK